MALDVKTIRIQHVRLSLILEINLS